MPRPSFAPILALVLGLAWAPGASAGPVQDFEAAVRSAYADYRVALFATNMKKGEESARALAGFAAKWSALAAAHAASPPPHHADDARFAERLAAVAAIAGKAGTEVAEGRFVEAHESLEAIRDQVADLRAGAGMVSFSDRVNAYHARMEHVLEVDHRGFDAAALASLREEAAVLAYLVADIAAHPAPEANDPAYGTLLGGLKASVEALLAAARSADATAAKAALAALKPAFSKFFIKFG